MKKIKSFLQHNLRPLHLIGRIIWQLPTNINHEPLTVRPMDVPLRAYALPDVPGSWRPAGPVGGV